MKRSFATGTNIFAATDEYTTVSTNSLALEKEGISNPVALMGILATIYINLDIIILGYLVDEVNVGQYVAASRVVIITTILPSLIQSAFLPALLQVKSTNTEGKIVAGNHARAICFLGGLVGGWGCSWLRLLLSFYLAMNLLMRALLLKF